MEQKTEERKKKTTLVVISGDLDKLFAAFTISDFAAETSNLTRTQILQQAGVAMLDVYSLAFALGFATVLHHLRREMQATQEMAEATIALSTEHGFPHWLAQGVIYRGWALAEQGRREEGIAQMREGLAAWRDVGAEMGRPYYLALLARVHR